MIRNVLGAIVALVGAAAAVLSPFRDWYDGRLGRSYRLGDLFTGTGVTGAHPGGLFTSLWLPFLCAAVVAVVGVVLRSRLLVALAGVVVLGFTVLWMVRQGQVNGSLAVASDGSGLQMGVASAAAGGVLLLLGAALMSGRRGAGAGAGRGRPYEAPGSADPDTWPPTREPGPSVQTTPWPEPEGDAPYVGPGDAAPGAGRPGPGAPGDGAPGAGRPGPPPSDPPDETPGPSGGKPSPSGD
ncbi:hypothetical protein P8A18_20025 [Streptomyces castrisilvae]|uniref:Integral membrane protein n=1 Tax=Streptomyces castrisilvae TaxID=3033811 RepID=A0ABY9HNJ1_9ACTN|nr:hypothetical protein [Streptomyces sp. Mut1]WLQ35563.1 hypothetical protein P8A18_20025 [Streptomyces sp. Mut1]